MLRINEGDYAYASARIRAKEPRLLGKSQFDRMLEAPAAEEAYKVLTEAEYGIEGSGMTGLFAFEELLSGEMKKCYMLLSEITPHQEVIRAFQRRHDYFNIKVLLKAEFSGAEVPRILMDTGTIGTEEITRMIRERDYSELTPLMSEAISEAYDVFSRTQDPQTIDLILDRASSRQQTMDLNAIDSPYLRGIAEIMTDITNIRVFIRARLLNKAWDFIKKLLAGEGTISQEIFLKNSDKPAESFIEELQHSRYGKAVSKGWELYKTKKSLSGLEKLLEDYLMQYVQSAKMVTMGVEPVVAYLFAKEAELRNVRIIMTGKINRLPVDLIRERLREVYV